MDKKVVAIYARKSKATDRGESLKVQIEKCRQLVMYKYGEFDLELLIYEEQEGKTGANLNRGQFKKLMKDIKNRAKPIDILIVYKLDRLTRSVQDFSEIYEVLNTYGTEFISVKEDFDTTTPMGRAMLTITVVFAQLEREVTAERIQDAMMELAKTGRWLGGMTPYAYTSKQITYMNDAGQVKNKYHLKIIPEEAQILKTIYDTYLEMGSLSKAEACLMDENMKTRREIDFSRYGIKYILSNPVYCEADLISYDYFMDNGYTVYSSKKAFDGKHGIMAYNKTQTTKHLDTKSQGNDMRWKKKEDWVIAVGEHIPLITSEDWIKVQKMMEVNRAKSYRSSRTTDALFSGLLKCKCGHAMRPKVSGKSTGQGEKAFYYLCEGKERSRGLHCNTSNISGNKLDDIIISKIIDLQREIVPIYDNELIIKNKWLQNTRITNLAKDTSLKNQLLKTKQSLDNIKKAILKADSEEAIADFVDQYQKTLSELTSLNALLELRNELEIDGAGNKEIVKLLSCFNMNFWNELSYEQKKSAVKELVDKITWDGKTVDVYFKFSANHEEEQMNC